MSIYQLFTLKKQNLQKIKSFLSKTIGRGWDDAMWEMPTTDAHHYLPGQAACSRTKLPQFAVAVIMLLHIYAPHVKFHNSINSSN